ncbi:DSBA-like thioredoxin domain-containing protein OS=Tsukamurella paurometabola (strain ATCC 8368 /DSM / CCUG 35730 / CIP 100753 / JCM 10117 / KCTC 9821/ NBRC 16120 / NCIMB 702349 / NCTC 13040) OX=521096 GN=Tpau_0106 PE=4 SV=1 [Tsukamurella paurometabola]|uniref:DSBA-like thioredoxin domain-containing protein n=1 Tax=Tsukamurella paurometabola (strain ATCC 8368 / DSM 20162 / CCUG 35730 / CIP 100753 / JCM 10117 / KCTC 9821 / NBRC 16120 / NCIMB 702349 / NCTC 13040) TaxID=521096 RepID=D5UPZ2_TSUPD|nr:hypothetical protein [Tsukamurella paurometabola]ADG76760.1 conserved hypothetical protein [Tsukamurella paurometabola DSM 20162]SUP41509.1 Uncharacterised protein [Tsukamurella paurometabola]
MEHRTPITIWLDPVCPYSWQTAAWLRETVDDPDALRWELMSLALLNEGRDLPERARARMRDSGAAGRLFAALGTELDDAARWRALAAFSAWYHHDAPALDAAPVARLLTDLGLPTRYADALADASWDVAVRAEHARSQEAAGGSAGSPLVRIGEATFHGPVLTTVPEPEAAAALLAGLRSLAAVDAFTSVQRLRPDQ